MKKNKVKNNWLTKHETMCSLILVFLIGCFYCLWLCRIGIINGDDTWFHISRIIGLKNSLANGDIQALIHAGLFGYGYANGLFYGNLLLYPSAVLELIGFPSITAFKVLIALCTMLQAFTMFWCTKSITKSNKTAVISSFLYTGCAYRIYDMIGRSAIGELEAFVFLPIVVLGLYELLYRDYKKWYLFAIGFVGLAQCHILSTIMAFIICLGLIIANVQKFRKEPKRFMYLCFAAGGVITR